RDQPARVAELLEQRAAVVRIVLEALRVEHRPARGERDQEREQQDEQPEEVADLVVHATTPPVSSCRCRAESDTTRRSASSTKFAMIELPPEETSGNATPARRTTRATAPTVTDAW